jgi:putative lipoic acid-binding regulatory protein
MGTYDPMQTMPDNERSSGNILNAMLQFPTEYCFYVLGKTDGDEDKKQMYINEVKQIVGIDKELRVIERGTRYVKLSVNVTVDSTAVINTIYEALGSLERTVMKF